MPTWLPEEPKMRSFIYLDRDPRRHSGEYSFNFYRITKDGRQIAVPPPKADLWLIHNTDSIKDEFSFWENVPPVVRMAPDEVQLLLDEIWKQGFRPSVQLEEIKGRGDLQAHLLDMRTLVAQAYSVQLPGTQYFWGAGRGGEQAKDPEGSK